MIKLLVRTPLMIFRAKNTQKKILSSQSSVNQQLGQLLPRSKAKPKITHSINSLLMQNIVKKIPLSLKMM